MWRVESAGKRIAAAEKGPCTDERCAVSLSTYDCIASHKGLGPCPEVAQACSLLPRQRQALQSIAGSVDPVEQDKALSAALALALVTGGASASVSAATIQGIQEQGLITVSGELTDPCSLFVIVGGSREDGMPTAIEGPLLEGFKAVPGPVTVVGCESYLVAASSIPTFQAAGISTVDCIDLPLGQIALPYALRGDVGDYGLKLTAHQQLPSTFGGSPVP